MHGVQLETCKNLNILQAVGLIFQALRGITDILLPLLAFQIKRQFQIPLKLTNKLVNKAHFKATYSLDNAV